MTLHPEGKEGVNITRARYDVVKESILDTIGRHGEISYRDLNDEVYQQLDGKFDGKIVWYVVTVKLDLEARGQIERIQKKSPQMLRLAT